MRQGKGRQQLSCDFEEFATSSRLSKSPSESRINSKQRQKMMKSELASVCSNNNNDLKEIELLERNTIKSDTNEYNKRHNLSTKRSFAYQNSLKPYDCNSAIQHNCFVLGRSASGSLLENPSILKTQQIFPQRIEKKDKVNEESNKSRRITKLKKNYLSARFTKNQVVPK